MERGRVNYINIIIVGELAGMNTTYFGYMEGRRNWKVDILDSLNCTWVGDRYSC